MNFFKIRNSFEGDIKEFDSSYDIIGNRFENILVESSLYSFGQPITVSFPIHLKTYKNWETVITFPIQFCDLPLDAVLCITLYDYYSPKNKYIIGGTTFPLFSKKKILKTGKFKLKLWKEMEADGSIESKTLGKLPKEDFYGEIEKVNILPTSTFWLDKLTEKRINSLKIERKFKENEFFLNIQLLSFSHPVIHDVNKIEMEENYEIIEKQANKNMIMDEECHQMNPCEEKYTLTSMGACMNHTDLIPSTSEIKKLESIIAYTAIHDPNGDEQRLMWKFRYYLKSNKKALIMFLKIVNWENNEKQVEEVQKLLSEWSEPTVEDALVLVSRFFAFNTIVRKYAVNILKKADDDTIIDILLQLVQGLRYDVKGHESDLSKFLIQRALNNEMISYQLYRFVNVETSDPKKGELYKSLRHSLVLSLKKKKETEEILDKICRQDELINAFTELSKELKASKDKRENKIVELKKTLSQSKGIYNWNDILNSPISSKFEKSPLPLILDPRITITSIISNETTIFKSAKNPIMITFKESLGNKYRIIWKSGDDIRQDQLVLQILNLMNKLLLKDGLDLKLTAYQALATSTDTGLLECVTPSTALANILEKKTIKGFLEEKNPKNFDESMDNFIKSCAGYCVVSFILGIGDRHLDNILMKDDGRMFHIDFGFILGNDPKPFPPPVKLCKEMVIAMGGGDSKGYQKFKEYCCTAYNILRKNAKLIINLFVLMVDANIPNITSETHDPYKNIMKVQEKFKLELNDQEAIVFMQSILNESEKALFPQITETFHRWAQYWRS